VYCIKLRAEYNRHDVVNVISIVGSSSDCTKRIDRYFAFYSLMFLLTIPCLLIHPDIRYISQTRSSPFDGIMEGHYTLVDIRLPSDGLLASADGTQKYKGVQGRFCVINWKNQADNPSKVPMFKDLEEQSMLCDSTMYSVDLWDIARKAHDYDNRNHTFAATAPRPGQGPVKPTAVVFHETRCGSTLIANVLAAFSPERSRVYSESPPPVTALAACDKPGRPCDDGAQSALIQDVFYLMGRALEHNMRKYVFYKIQSVGVKYIDAFTKAMPDTPWIFAYRDSIEIMMSHFKNYQQGNPLSKNFQAVCLRNYGSAKKQPPLLTKIVESVGRTVSSLSPEEYCAAHLATLSESAIREYERTYDARERHQHHWFVNYKELPYKIWETILPELVGPVKESQIEHMMHISKSYSKGRGPKADTHFHEDATVKQSKAPDSVKEAVKVFLDPTYEKMETIRKSMEPNGDGHN
jgi:hypothetical protein